LRRRPKAEGCASKYPPTIQYALRTMALPDTLAAGSTPHRSSALSLAIFGAIVIAIAVAGMACGFLWAAVAPRVAVSVTGHGLAEVVNPETKAFIAADGWFCVISAAAGLLAGVAGYLAAVRRNDGAATLALIVGGLAASLAQWWVGKQVGLASFRSALLIRHAGTVLHAPLALRAHGAVVIWPLTTALVVGLAELLAGRRHP
jgi:hypothetical protein